MKIVTHNGHFHSDELFAISALLLKFPDAEIIRTRDEKIIDQGDIVVDVGQVYDPDKRRFDHHQREGAGERENGIPYASFGLVWKEYGEELAGGKEEQQVIDIKLVVGIDALDNGVDIQTLKFENVSLYSIGDFFQSFVEGAKTMEELEKSFFKALPLAKELLEREIKIAQKLVFDWRNVAKIYEQLSQKEIVVLPEHMAWKQILIPSNALFVVYPREDDRWALQAINKQFKSFDLKKPLPNTWLGLRDAELARATGVSDAVFCHKSGFLAITQTQEGAVKLAEIALNS